jgi:Trypsin
MRKTPLKHLPVCRVLLLLWWLCSLTPEARARLGSPPISRLRPVQPLDTVAQLALPAVDARAELAVDQKALSPTPRRFAVPSPVAITPESDGTWESLADGRLWRLRVVAPGATDLNFGFTMFHLPPGATLHIYSEDEDYYQGPYTGQDATADAQLWTPVVPGQRAVIELFVPAQAAEEPQLVLSQVGLGYRDLFHHWKDLNTPKSGSCEINVVCPQGDPWRKEIQSVALYTVSGSVLCTGTLIMDAVGDFRSYFLTANHCGVDSTTASTVVVYWNYDSPTCGVQGGGSLAQNQSGATFRAAKYDVDFTLIELNAVPDPSFRPYYAGWDRSGVAPVGCVGIHHPNADEKTISFSTTTLTTINSCIGTGGSLTHWQVYWSAGVTEPGSSGSGIWDPKTHLLVGTLSGGYSSCSAPNSPDCYGKFSVAWASGSSSASRLKDWLDPLNTGVTSVPGHGPPYVVLEPAGSALVSESCTNDAVDPGEQVTLNFGLANFGGTPTTNLVATLLATNGVVFPGAPRNYGALVESQPAVTRPFTFIATGSCGGTIHPTFELQDGPAALGRVIFDIVLGQLTAFYTENFDGVGAPALPAGWTTTAGGGQSAWVTSAAQSDTPPNSAFSTDAAAVGTNALVSPVLALPPGPGVLSFRNNFTLENGYDGGVLEIKIGAGVFTDIIAAGGSFVSGGYNQVISSAYGNPLGGRAAWSGSSAGFITTTVNLPASASGQNIQLRWRCGTDSSVSAAGWYVDTITLNAHQCCPAAPLLIEPQISHNVFTFTLAGGAGRNYAIDGTTNLALSNQWSQILVLSNATGVVSFTNSPAAPWKFYRARLLP